MKKIATSFNHSTGNTTSLRFFVTLKDTKAKHNKRTVSDTVKQYIFDTDKIYLTRLLYYIKTEFKLARLVIENEFFVHECY